MKRQLIGALLCAFFALRYGEATICYQCSATNKLGAEDQEHCLNPNRLTATIADCDHCAEKVSLTDGDGSYYTLLRTCETEAIGADQVTAVNSNGTGEHFCREDFCNDELEIAFDCYQCSVSTYRKFIPNNACLIPNEKTMRAKCSKTCVEFSSNMTGHGVTGYFGRSCLDELEMDTSYAQEIRVCQTHLCNSHLLGVGYTNSSPIADVSAIDNDENESAIASNRTASNQTAVNESKVFSSDKLDSKNETSLDQESVNVTPHHIALNEITSSKKLGNETASNKSIQKSDSSSREYKSSNSGSRFSGALFIIPLAAFVARCL